MSTPSKSPIAWYHCNLYNAAAACEHCGGIIRHEPWCIKVHPVVCYAFDIVEDPAKLTIADALALHSLGVTWNQKSCSGGCKIKT
jgi:hypothetical protein